MPTTGRSAQLGKWRLYPKGVVGQGSSIRGSGLIALKQSRDLTVSAGAMGSERGLTLVLRQAVVNRVGVQHSPASTGSEALRMLLLPRYGYRF